MCKTGVMKRVMKLGMITVTNEGEKAILFSFFFVDSESEREIDKNKVIYNISTVSLTLTDFVFLPRKCREVDFCSVIAL